MVVALLGLVGVAVVLHIATLVASWLMLPPVMMRPGVARIATLSWSAYKIWIVLFLSLTLMLSVVEIRFDWPGPPMWVLEIINFLLIAYLIIGPVVETVALAQFWLQRRERLVAMRAAAPPEPPAEGGAPQDDAP